MPDVPVLLFDLGGVLVQASGIPTLQRLAPHLERAEVVARWHASKAVGSFERGNIGPEEFAQAFTAEWQLQLSPAEFLTVFAGWVEGPYPGATELLRSLRGRHTLACLSNTNATHWAKLTEIRELFDVCVPSHLIGCMKPEPGAYHQALQKVGAPASSVCFFDDHLPNVAAARAVGMRAFHVQGVAATLAALHDAGVQTSGYASPPAAPKPTLQA